MPKVRRSKKKPPEGWELIEPTLDELDQKLREGNVIYCRCYYDVIGPQLKVRLMKESVKLKLYGQYSSELR